MHWWLSHLALHLNSRSNERYDFRAIVPYTLNSLFNVGLGESKMTTLNTDLRYKNASVSAKSLDLSEKEGNIGLRCPRPHCST